MATSCEELTHWKRLWCWEGLGVGEGDDRRWDGWIASWTRWSWVWANSGIWWTGSPGVLRFMGSQRVGHDWETELNWITGSWEVWEKKHRLVLSTPHTIPSIGNNLHQYSTETKKLKLLLSTVIFQILPALRSTVDACTVLHDFITCTDFCNHVQN